MQPRHSGGCVGYVPGMCQVCADFSIKFKIFGPRARASGPRAPGPTAHGLGPGPGARAPRPRARGPTARGREPGPGPRLCARRVPGLEKQRRADWGRGSSLWTRPTGLRPRPRNPASRPGAPGQGPGPRAGPVPSEPPRLQFVRYCPKHQPYHIIFSRFRGFVTRGSHFHLWMF